MQNKPLILALLAGLALSGAAQATLIDRSGGLIYDDVLNITWLQNANYANGKMNWDDANAWAANLSYYDSVRAATYDDWRLPTMLDTGSQNCNFNVVGTDCGWNVQTRDAVTGVVYSEMAYMYYTNLGLKAPFAPIAGIDFTPQAGYGIFGNGTIGGQNNVGLINNLQSSGYWSGLQAAFPTSEAWYFQTEDGAQGHRLKTVEYYAWAVRAGDVRAANFIPGPNVNAVPEPQTLALLGLGLLGLAVARRRR